MDKIDLHNDLLNYLLLDSSRTAYDHNLSCSIPEMIAGEIKVQVLAAFSLTPNDSSSLSKQFHIYQKLKETKDAKNKNINLLWSIEDAQQLIGESDLGNNLDNKINYFIETNNTPVYISLTWIHENEFGGGDRTNIGLKSKGKELLDILAKTNIAIDLSHASDELANDIINYIEKKSYQSNIIASHTNFRAVHNVQRNISDEIAKYILDKNGLIGLSFSKNQLGSLDKLNIQDHYAYALSLNPKFEDVACLGGDLYHQLDVPIIYRRKESNFFPELSTASNYQILNNLPEKFLFKNALRYLRSNSNLKTLLQLHP